MNLVVARYAIFVRPAVAHDARARSDASPSPQETPARVVAPANDTVVADPLPSYALTDARRASLRERALALPASSIKKLPAFVDRRVVWMGGVHATAWRDRAAFVGWEVDDGPITIEELNDLGYCLEYVREVCVQRSMMASAPASATAVMEPAAMTDAAIAAELSSHHATLRDAFQVRFAKHPRARGTLKTMRSDRYAPGLARNDVRVLSLCEEPGAEAWLRRLPRGEGAALDRVSELHPEWCCRIKAREVDTTVGAVTPMELAQRVWALVQAPFERVLRAGRYLVKRDATRHGAYRGFRVPVRRTPIAQKPAPLPPTPSPA